LGRLNEEPKYTAQALGIYKGSLGFISWFATIVNIALLIVAAFALIRFFSVSPVIADMLKWGGLTAFCICGIWVSKIWFGLHLHTNRVLRELKKLELQIASLKQNP
jgi:uncharacterized membrane protein YciS (DUF1049 family)